MATDFPAAVLSRLQASQLLTADKAEALLASSNGNAATALQTVLKSKIVDPEDIAVTTAEVMNLTYIDLRNEKVPSEILNLIPVETARNYSMVPFKRSDAVVSVALANPTDLQAIKALDFIARQHDIQFHQFVASQAGVDRVLQQYESVGQVVEEALATTNVDDIDLGHHDDGDEVVHTAPVSKMISVVLKHAVEGESSDVHIEPVGDETRVRYRVDGVLHTSLVLPKQVHQSLVARIKVLANLKLDETRLPQDGRFKMKYEGRDVEFRVSTLPLLNNEKVVMRILDTSASVVSLHDLGYQDSNLQRVRSHLSQPHGMVLVTGPTGSGKSTTLYSMLSMLNREGVNIITLEDPVEYNIPGIAQSQMKPEIGLNFATGLRSVLRQDPDIIMVGEIRDAETAELAVHAALTGHMVLSTLHTNSAFGALPRLVDLGIEPFLIASALNISMAQRLVRKLCQSCREPITLDDSYTESITAEVGTMPRQWLPHDVGLLPPYTAYAAKGCTACEDTGYRGRIAISEVLENTTQVAQHIGLGEYANKEQFADALVDQGMFTMRQDGLIKVFRGLTSIEEVWNATKEK